RNLPAEADRGTIGLITGMGDVGRRPVVDQVAADSAARDDGESDRRSSEGNQQKQAGAFHRDFLRRRTSETPYEASTSAVQPYAAQTNDQPPVMYPPLMRALPGDPSAAARAPSRYGVTRSARAA